jgi:hypothetical protein
MKILYGQRGKPVGSIDGDAVFLKDGTQIAQVIGEYLYKVDDGGWIGSVMSGVLFNEYGAPQAFTDVCEEVLLPPPEPSLKTALPLPLPALGQDVRGIAQKQPPRFLLDSLSSTESTSLRDGYFA